MTYEEPLVESLEEVMRLMRIEYIKLLRRINNKREHEYELFYFTLLVGRTKIRKEGHDSFTNHIFIRKFFF